MKRISPVIKALVRILGVFTIFISLSSNGQDPPGSEPRVFLPDTVSNSDYVEFGCCFSPDGDEFYFSRTVGDSGAIYVMKRMDDAWATPVKLHISNAQYYSEPFITLDNSKMFFSEFHTHIGQRSSKGVSLQVHLRSDSNYQDIIDLSMVPHPIRHGLI
jgi:hypothetical protein